MDDVSIIDKRAGERIKQLRQATGLTQRDLLDRLSEHGLDLHQPQITWIEQGERGLRLAQVAIFADALGVTLTQLLGDEDDVELARIEDQRRAALDAIAERRKMIEAHQDQILGLHQEIKYYEAVINSTNNGRKR